MGEFLYLWKPSQFPIVFPTVIRSHKFLHKDSKYRDSHKNRIITSKKQTKELLTRFKIRNLLAAYLQIHSTVFVKYKQLKLYIKIVNYTNYTLFIKPFFIYSLYIFIYFIHPLSIYSYIIFIHPPYIFLYIHYICIFTFDFFLVFTVCKNQYFFK